MTVRSVLARAAVLTGAVTAMTVAGASTASAYHCYVPMYSLHGPTSSANWEVYSADRGAQEFFGLDFCANQRDAGYAALREAGMPVGIKIFVKMTIGENSSNPNGADGKGLEYFGAGSTLADDMLETYVDAASEASC